MKLNYKKDVIKISGIVKESIVDGPGIRYVIFSQGCVHNCDGCHNPETHDLFLGSDKNINSIFKEINLNPLLKGVTFSGGEPFLQSEAFYNLAKMIKEINLDIITYTGYTFNEILNTKDENKINLLKISDYIIDGKFDINKKTALIPFMGSSNQKVVDVKKSLQQKTVIEANF